MTDSTNLTRVSYTGDGNSTHFPIPFPFYLATDILVQLGGATVTNGYTITGGNGSTGTMVMATAPLPGVNVQVILNPPLTQTVNLVDGTAFPSATLNQVNDRAVQIGLRLQDQINRSIRVPDGDSAPQMLLPAASLRANKALMLDGNGNITTGIPNSQVITTDLLAPFLGLQQTSAEIAAGVTPTNYAYPTGDPRRYGVDTTGQVDCTTAINNALKCYASVILPPGTYLIDGSANSGVITLPPASALGAILGSVFFNITANSGLTDVHHSPFILQNQNQVYGLIINYPNQVVADLQVDILQYPPTFTINPANNAAYGTTCYIHQIICTRSYTFCSVQGVFADCLWENIVSSINLFRGLDFEGANVNMQDTSRIVNCQFEMVGPSSFNGGPVVQWVQANGIGISATTQGANRIDGLMVVNSNVVGGSIGIFAGVSVWIQAVNVGLDSVAQAILVAGVGSQFYGEEIWCSLQQPNYGLRQIPAIRCNLGILRLTNAEISLQTGGAQCAVFIDSGLVELRDIRFFTSRGGFAPAIFNCTGVVKCSGCTVSSTNSANPPRPLAWQDCVIGTSGFGNDTVTFSIDGKSGPIHWQGVLSPSNFNMSTWVGGVPTNWTTSAGTPANYFTNLQPIDGNTGIQIAGNSTGPFTLTYSFTTALDDLYGYFLFQCAIETIDPGGLGPANGFSIILADASGNNLYTVPISWPGSNIESLAIPVGSYYPLSVLLCAPAGSAPGKFVLNFVNASAANLTIRMKNITLWGMATPPEVSGLEYWGGQTSGKPRDISRGNSRLLLRAAAPTAGVWALQDTALNNASPAAGTTEWRCTTAGSPGTWTGLTIP